MSSIAIRAPNLRKSAQTRGFAESSPTQLWTPLTAGVKFPDQIDNGEDGKRTPKVDWPENNPKKAEKGAKTTQGTSPETPPTVPPPPEARRGAPQPDTVLSETAAFAKAQGMPVNISLSPWQAMIEGRIAEARRKGQFENLKGRGKKIEDEELPIMGVDNT